MSLTLPAVPLPAVPLPTLPLATGPTPWSLPERVAPNWFAAVMGTGIVATATAATAPGLHVVATGVWALAAALLLAVLTLTGQQWIRHPQLARAHHRHPVLVHFYGAPPMALLTVGAGALLLGPDLVGEAAAVRIDLALWPLGTAAGLVTGLVVPRLTRARLDEPGVAAGGQLIAVVPPMVSASTGALLLPHLPVGAARTGLLIGCYALVVAGLVACAPMIAGIAGRLARDGRPPARLVPTLWIVLGPLGQSATALALLGQGAHLAVGPGPAGLLRAAALGYGLPVLGLALIWLAVAARLTVRTARAGGLPFAPTWWSFTFPVGTCVTAAAGLAGLAGPAGGPVLAVLARILLGLLVSAWVTVSLLTLVPALRPPFARP